MKVLILSHLFPNFRDPTSGIFVLEQLKTLRRLGVEATVIAPVPWAPRPLRFWARVRKYQGIPSRETLEGFEVERPAVPMFPGGRLFFLYGLFYYLRCRSLVRRFLSTGAFDLIHAHTIMPDGCAAALLRRTFRLPVVCTVHGSDINLYPLRNRATCWVTGWALRSIDQLITVSGALRDKASTWVDGNLIEVVHNGADPAAFRVSAKAEARRILNLPQGKRVILFVGYFVEAKGLNFLLEAIAYLRPADTLLYLVGDGQLRENLVSMAQNLGISDLCVFTGACNHNEVPLWLSAADCLVLSSVTEGLPTILVEAMMCGVPIVTTAVGGIPEILKNNDTGLLVPAGDPLALAQAVARILDGPDFARKMARRAQAEAHAHLTWEANAQKTEAIYRRVLGKCDAPFMMKESSPRSSENLAAS